jgi:hypothetical protein
VIRKVLARVVVVIVAAALTLAAILALVQGTIDAISLNNLPLRVLAVLADLACGALLLVGCIWMVTRLAVLILGVGHEEFPPMPEEHEDDDHARK